MEKEHMSSGKILLSCRFRLPGYQQRMRTQDGTQEDSKGSSEYTGLNREMVDAFVEEIVVYAKDRVEIKWKFKDEFGEVEMSKKIECSVENMEMGWYN